MGQSRRADVEIGYKVDKSSVREVANANKSLQDSAKELRTVSQEANRLSRSSNLSDVAADAGTLSKQLATAEDNAKRLRSELDRVDKLNTQVRSDVGILGDVGTALNTLGGQDVAIIFEAGEAVAQLKAASDGLEASAKAAIQAVGVPGVALVGGIGALAIAAKLAQVEFEKAKAEAEAALNARRQFIEYSTTATSTELNERKAALEQRLALEEEVNRDLQLQYIRFFEETRRQLGDSAAVLAAGVGSTPFVNQFGGEATAGFAQFKEDLKESNQELDNLRGELSSINAALGTSAVAANDAAAEQDQYSESLQVVAQNAANTRIQTGLFLSDVGTTTEDLDSRLQRLQTELQLTADEIENNTGLAEAQRTVLEQRIAAMEAERDALLAGRPAVVARTEALELQAEIEKNSAELIEATARAQDLANRQRLQGIVEQVSREKEYARLQRDATTGATADRIQSLTDERAALESLIAELEPIAGDSEQFAFALATARDDLRRVNSDIERTFGDVAPAALKRFAQSIQDDIANAGVSRQQAVNEAASTRSKGLQDAARTLNEGLTDLDRDFSRQQAESKQESIRELEQFQRDERDRVRDHQNELARIQRDAQDTIQDAALSLDAAGIRRARRERDRQLDDAQARFDIETEQAEQRLELIKQEAADERRELIQNYQDRRRDLLNANRQTVNDLNQRYRTEVQTAQSAYTTQVNLLNQKLQAETNLINQAYGAQLQAVKNFAQQSANLLQQAQQSAQQAAVQSGKQRVQNIAQGIAGTGIGSSLSNIFGGLLGFKDGGRVPYDGIFRLHEGEEVYNREQQAALSSMIHNNQRSTVIINAPGADAGTVRQIELIADRISRTNINIGVNELIDRVSA